jgi:hypothetical protein
MGKTKSVKTKKAIKRMDKAEELLSKLLKQFSEARDGVRELLSAGRTSVLRARAKVKAPAKEASVRMKSPVKAKPIATTSSRRTVRAPKSKRISRPKALPAPAAASSVLH